MARPEEDAARQIVEALTTERTLRRLDVGGAQLADYEIVDRKDQRVGLLEVTRSTPANRLSFDASLARFDWKFEGLRRSWWVHVSSVDRGHVPLQALHRDLGPVLASRALVDADGIVEVDPWSASAPEWHKKLHGVGVVWMQAYDPGMIPCEVHIRKPNTVGALGWSLINDAVESELSKPDNLAKLRAKEADQFAELFIWLTDSAAQLTLDFAGAQLLRGGGPTTAFALPRGITGIWVASGPNDLTRLARSVYFSDGSAWQPHPPPLRQQTSLG